MVKYTLALECLRGVYYLLKKLAGGKKTMADFFDQEWNSYTVRLRPNDWVRNPISRLPFLLDMIPYFSASYISFDLRLFIPREKSTKWYAGVVSLFPELNRREQGSFRYEWQLCDDNNNPITSGGKSPIRFYNNSGDGFFEFNTERAKKKELTKAGYIIVKDNYGHWFRKTKVVDVGRLNRFAHYNILMRFTTNDGIASDWKLMASFRLFDKDMFWVSGCLPTIISITVTLVTVFLLRGCGLQP